MDSQIDILTTSLLSLNINKKIKLKLNPKTNYQKTQQTHQTQQNQQSQQTHQSYQKNITQIIKIQSWFRGCIYRLKHLPLIMYKIQKYLKTTNFTCATENEDGRLNSCTDEPKIIKLLIEKFGNRIKQPETSVATASKKKKNTDIKKTIIRMWYDILAFDYTYGWLPINIKTTTMTKNDNIGNLATSVYSYTDEQLNLHTSKTYENGKMSIILFDKLKAKKYNRIHKKDYYFLVLNKTNPCDIIVNSVKGLTILNPNINNLPFQVCWNKNREFYYEHIDKKIKLFIDCLQKPKPVWSEKFMANIRTIKL